VQWNNFRDSKMKNNCQKARLIHAAAEVLVNPNKLKATDNIELLFSSTEKCKSFSHFFTNV